MVPIASRLKDALGSIRRAYGLAADIDPIVQFIVFEREFTENIFIDYPKRVPKNFNSALLDLIRHVVRLYASYVSERKNYHKVLRGILALEDAVRHGPDAYDLLEDKNTGFFLQLKSRFQKKKGSK